MRLIDADALKPYLLNEHYHYRSVYDADEVKKAPSVDIVRCKDCLAYESEDGFCYVHADHMTEDDFCSRGTKRE